MRVNEKMRKALSILLCVVMLTQYVPTPAFAVTTAEDGLCAHHAEHTAECGYAAAVAGQACTHKHSEDCYAILACVHTCGDECGNGCEHECTVDSGCITMELDCHHTHGDCGYSEGTAEVPCGHRHDESCGYVEGENSCAHAHDEACGYQEAAEGTPCTHECKVIVDSDASCYKLLCSHKDGGHDDTCGYVPAVEGRDCRYECTECNAFPSGEGVSPTGLAEEASPASDGGTLPEGEGLGEEKTCTCGTDDESIHATNCAVYVAPEDPACYCAEKCTEPNVWCDVCGFDYTACSGTDGHTGYEVNNPVLDISQGPIVLEEGQIVKGYDSAGNDVAGLTYSGSLTIVSESTTNNTITVASGTHNIVLDNCTIKTDTTGDCAFSIASDATVTLELEGTNTLKSGSNSPAISVPSGATLTIESDSGTLEATGGYGSGSAGGAGIGGGAGGDAGTITINGGTVTATGGAGGRVRDGGAGIGGGAGGAGGTITINGGTVTATGGYGFAPGGNGGSAGGDGAAGIGGAGGTITINGGTVTATGGNGGNGGDVGEDGAGIDGAGGTVTINGGNINADVSPSPTDEAGNTLTKVTITLSGASQDEKIYAIYDASDNLISYGLQDVKTFENGKLYCYLPVMSGNDPEIRAVVAGSNKYSFNGVWDGNSATFVKGNMFAYIDVKCEYGDMEFEYSGGTYDAETEQRENQGWICAEANANRIVVTNNSNCNVDIVLEYESSDDFSPITGLFSTNTVGFNEFNGDNVATGTDKAAYLRLTGIDSCPWDSGFTQIGTIIVTVFESEQNSSSETDNFKETMPVYAKIDSFAIDLTGGEGMRCTSGQEHQTVKFGGEMDSVVYMADDGYYFPEDYTEISDNVTRDSNTQITVSGILNGNLQLTLPDASKCENHSWDNGTCTVCGAVCDHGGETPTYDNGTCTVCGLVCAPHTGGTQTCMGYKCANCANWYGEKNDTHDWSGKDGICTNGCGTTHAHAEADWNNGTCTVCGLVCAPHSGSYSAEGNVITERCTICGGTLGTATLTAEGKTYDGTAFTAAVTGEGTLAENEFPITYCCQDGCIRAGEHTASIALGEITASADFTIEKRELTLRLTDCYKGYDGTKLLTDFTTRLEGFVFYDEGSYNQPDILDFDDVYDDVAVDAENLTVILPDCAPGAYTTATVRGITLTGKTAGNYTIAETLENVLIFGYSGWEFEVTKASVTITSLDQNVEQGAGLDQTAYTVNDLVDGHHLSGVVLEADGSQIRVNTEKVVITNADDVDVTEYFDITGYSEGIITETCQNHSFNADGFCAAGLCDVYEAAKRNDNGTEDEYDDYYEISNAGQLYWFAQRVNEYGENEIRAVLVADITVPAGRQWTPILNFYGNFDGNFKTISGLYCTGVENAGLFGGGGYAYGTIRNVHLTNSTFEGSGNVGGIAGYHAGIIENCSVSNTVSVSGTSDASNSALLIGYNGGTISNCYAYGSSFVGYMYPGYGSINNCYFLSEANDEYGTVGMTAAQFASGEVAWLLQDGQESDGYLDENDEWVETEAPHVWGQTIGTDLYPVLGGAKVYRNITGGCCEENYIYSYSNTAADPVITHIFDENGFCACGEYEEAVINGDAYEIYNAGQLYWFAQQVNGGNTAIDGKLMNNITVNENVLNDDGTLNGDGSNFRPWTPIGNSSIQYTGTFTGNGKTVSGLYFNNSSTNYVGLFGYVDRNGNVQNVGVVDSYFCGNRFVGGVVGSNSNTVENCYNTGAVTGGSNVGGVVGENTGPVTNCYNLGSVSGNSEVGGVVGMNFIDGTVENCYNTGTVTGSNSVGGVVGHNHEAGTVENCYNSGLVVGSSYVGGVAGDNHVDGTVTGCYYLDKVGETTNPSGIDGEDVEGSAEARNADQFASGEVAYLLQGEQTEQVWGQNIDNSETVQTLPVFSTAKVYRNKDCMGNATYSNTDTEDGLHDFDDNGFCTICGGYQPATDSDNDGYYEIDNAGKLYWFADKVNNDNANFGSANAILTDDITVNTGVLKSDGTLNGDGSGFRAWTPIGNDSSQYTGTFTGNGKTVSGLYFNNSSTDYVGLFGYVGWNGNVQNVGVVDSYFCGNLRVGGVVGRNNANGGSASVTNCYNTGTVDGIWYVGGVVGDNFGGTVENSYNTGSVSNSVSNRGRTAGGVVGLNSGTVTNCYNLGSVSGNSEVGGVVGMNYSGGTVENCYNLGLVDGSGMYVGGVVAWNYSDGTVENCYNSGTVTGSDSVGGVVGKISSGKVTNCYNTGTVTGSDPVGGVVGNISSGKVTNCYNTGTVTGSSDRVGGVAGNNTGTVVNCWNTGTVTGSFNVGGVAGNNTGTVANCYYLTGCAADGNKTTQYGIGNGTKGSTTADVADSTTGMSAAQFASGEVAYRLQNGVTAGEDGTIPQVWGQNIDNGETKQTAPVFSDAKVYHGYADCQATAVTYTNAVASETVIAHTYENGICTNLLADRKTVCGGYQPATDSDNDGYYEIDNAGKLYWFAALVNGDTTATGGVAQNKAANAVLTADITVNADLMKKITVAEDGTAAVNEGENLRIWTPIGVYDYYYDATGEHYTNFPYLGTFDGQNHTISGLYFNKSTVNYVGLFGYVDGGTVRNVSVVDSYFCGKWYVGGVVGRSSFATVENCRNTGTVTGSAGVGGVVGQDDNGTITNCHNTGSVSAKNGSAGGVVGRTSGTFENCHNTGTVTGSGTYVGGVVGNNTGTFTNCCNTGTVTGSSDRVGGVAGNNAGTVANCWNTGTVTGSFNVGGVAGNNTGTVANCYYLTGCAADGNKTTQYGIGNGTKGSTTADVADSTTGMSAAQFASGEVAYKLSQGCTVGEGDAAVEYSGEVWGQNLDNDETPDEYPTLTGAKVYPVTNTGCPAFGDHTYTNTSDTETVNKAHVYVNGFCTNASSDGTVCDAYQPAVYSESNARYEISNAGQLYWFAALVNGDTTATGGVAQNKAANAVLTADITVNADLMKKITVAENGTAEVNEGENLRIWTPIGDVYARGYTGTFDGGNKTVSGLYFNDSEVDYVGLFGCVDGGTVRNVSIADSYFRGKSCVGGVVGYNGSGTVTNCSNTGTVTGSNNVGGVVGRNHANGGSASVTNCRNTGTVTGSGNSVGGVVGNNSGTVANCWNTGTVTGSTYVGGVVGYNHGTSTVVNCYNTGTITGSSSYVGGVVGYNHGTSTVVNCYNTGTITGSSSSSYVGGVAGYNYRSTVTNCYYLTGCAADGNKTTQYGIGNGTKGSTTADVADSTTGMSAAQFASGEVAYKLSQGCTVGGNTYSGDVWKQTIGTDVSPNFTGAKVYQLTNCKGEAGGYSNTEGLTGVHSYGNPVYAWSEDPITLQVTVTCGICSEPLFDSTDQMDVTTSDDGLTTTYTATVTLDGKDYTASHQVTNTVASVNITWGEMSFTYTDGTGWNTPDTAYVTVENTGNTDVNVAYTYVTERRDIAGSFSDGTSTITTPVAIAPENRKQVWLILSNQPSEALDNETIGTVKLTIK